MAIKSGFFMSVNGDRKYNAAFFAEYFATFIGNGVFPNPSNGLQIISNGDMTVTMKPGKAWINGYYINNNADYILKLDNADGVLNRIDRVVLQLNFLNREIGVVIKKGTPASTPVAPVLQRDVDVYEIALADIAVNKGVISISQSNISDLRLNTEYCGVVHGLVDQVDTTTLYNQYLDFWTTWKDQKVGEFAEFQTDSQVKFDEQSSTNQQTFDGMIVAKQSEFETWFDSVKGMLEGDVATNLSLQIQTIQSEMESLTSQLAKIEKDINEPLYKIVENRGNAFSVGTDYLGTSYKSAELVSNDLRLDGQTLVNVVNGFTTGGSATVTNEFINNGLKTTTKSLGSVIQRITPKYTFKENTVYTLMLDCTQTIITSDKVFSASFKVGSSFAENRVSFKIPNDSKQHIVVKVTAPANAEELVFGIHFTSDALGYLQTENVIILEGDYTNKPLPSYFEGLKSVAQSNSNKIEISSVNENLIPPFSKWGRLHANATIVNDYELKLNATNSQQNSSTSVNVVSGKTYTLVSDENTLPLLVYALNSDGTNGTQLVFSTDKTKTFVVPKGINNINLVASNINKIGALTLKNPILSPSSQATTFTPQKTNKTEILLNEPLRSLPNGVKDTVEIVDNKAIVTRRCGEVVLNGSENWASNLGGLTSENRPNTNQYFSTVLDELAKPGGGAVSDRYVLGNPYSVDKPSFSVVNGGGNVNILRVADIKISITEWKLKLKANPVTVVYELETPTVEEIELLPPHLYEHGSVFIESGVIPLSSTFHEIALNLKAQVKTAYDLARSAFQSANNGKIAVANAITAKGVSASSTDTFSVLATKIGQINTGKKWASGTMAHSTSTLGSVRGLDFRPSLIIAKGTYGNAENGDRVYIFEVSTNTNIVFMRYSSGSWGRDSNIITVYNNGFDVKRFRSGSESIETSWIAIE